jgi:release factor glutamine methyltransferase
MKIKEVLDKTIQFFKDKKMESARLEAEWLIGAGLGLDRVQLYLKFDQPLKEDELAKLREMVKRRISGEPLAYITGSRGFYGLDFQVTKDVLIPRPETETLVEKALDYIKTVQSDEIQIVDLGSGSGCIGLTLAKKDSRVKVTLVDVSGEALKIARLNADKLSVQDQCQFIESDAANFLSQTTQQFDLILANPPYIDLKDLHVEENVKKFEPNLALFADGGTSLLKKWSAAAPTRLKNKSLMMMEMGFDQGPQMKSHFEELNSFEKVEVLKDLSGHERVILGEKNG